MPTSEYNLLLKRLDAFIRKYYFNELRKGIFLLLTVFLLSSLIVFIVEYFFRMSSSLRTIIFYTTVTLYILIFIRFVVYPLILLLKIKKGISYKDAAQIISSHFNHIKDSFTNTLELAELSTNKYSIQLLMASIDKRISEIKLLPFDLAIDIRSTYRFFKYFIAIVVLYICIWLYKPVIIKEGSERMVYYNKEFIPPAPFKFILLNEKLLVPQGSDIEIKVKIAGQYVPQKVYINFGSTRLLLNQSEKSVFTYVLKGINRSTDFFFDADGYKSNNYQIEMIFPPTILNFKVQVIPPAYTGISPTIIENTGDITAPAGSSIQWIFLTSYTDSIIFLLNDSISLKPYRKNREFYINNKFYHSTSYSILPINKQIINPKPMVYELNIIPDVYPSIQADFITDSTMWGMYYFKGTVSDDYGFRSLNFIIRYANDSIKEISIPIQNNILNQEFYFSFDFSSLKNYSGNIEYYFEVWDNDGIRGSKSSKTSVKTFRIPDKQELENYRSETTKSIISQLEQTEKYASDIQRELKKLQQSLTNTKSVTWEQTQKFQQLMQKQLQLEKTLKQLSEQNKQKNNLLRTFSEQDLQLLEKQKQIQELLENILDDELKNLIQQLNEMMNNIDKDKLQQMTQEFNIKSDEINKELDRTLELLKKLDIEEKMKNLTDRLNNLSQQQEKLSEQTLQKNVSIDSLKSNQEYLKEKFKELQKDYQDIMKQNNQLNDPFSMQSFQEEQQNIEQQMQDIEQELQQNDRKNASKKQKNTANQLKELSQKMQQMMQQNSMQQNEEDEQALKFLLENIKNLSFTQEEILLKTKQVKPYDPQYQRIIQQQNNVRGNIKVIEDSLNTLAKRNPIIGPPVKKHLKNIKSYANQTIKNLDERNVSQAQVKQQLLMTEANELALLMDQILKQMQEIGSEQMCQGGQCKKKSKGQPKPGYQQLKNMQQQIKQQLQSILNEMKNQQNQKEGKNISEQLGKMISMQDKMQQILNEMMSESGISPESMKKLQEIKNLMNDVQKDIANRNITNQTLFRQEQILTRLLEAEKSDNEREKENKRESQTGKNDKISNPKEIFQYKGKKSLYDEILFNSNLPLQKFYQELYRKYMINLNQ